MSKSAIYVRVSTNHQIDKDSLPLQKEDMINYSKFVLNIPDYEVFEDAGFSGKNTIRPAFQEMTKRIKQGEFSHLLVWKIDRISRNLLDFCALYDELKSYGCTFVSKNEQFDSSTAMGEAMLKIILIFAELERKLTCERVSATMISRATKGLWNGAPIPLGYKWDESIKFPVIDDIERKTVELIFNEYKKYQSSSIIRNLLNENHIKTKKDGTWSTKTISDIIRNPFYKGTYRYNYRQAARGKKKDEKEWVILDNNHAAIISLELWNECNEIMDLNATRSNARFRTNAKTHIFASLIECGECGINYYAKQDKAHNDGYIPTFYVCRGRYNKLGCNQKTINDTLVCEFVFNLISNINKISECNKFLSLQEFEKMLLTGPQFKSVTKISNIKEIFELIDFTHKNQFILNRSERIINLNEDHLQLQLNKYNKALVKLDDLYLFDNADMSNKDYLVRKTFILEKIESITKKIDKASTQAPSSYDLDFVSDIVTLEISNELKKGNIKLKPLINKTDRDILKKFVNTIISKVIVKDKQIRSIEFKNGLFINFSYE